MIKGLSSKKDIIHLETEGLIQNIIPITYNVDYKSLEHGEVFDSLDIKLNPISDSFLTRENEKDIVICVSIDGSLHSEYCVNLILEEFMPLINKKGQLDKENCYKCSFLGVYVYFSSKDKDFNYSNSKQTIINKFCEKFGKFKSHGNFYIEDRWSMKHAVHQVCINANSNKANFLVAGYFGFKGPKGENKELSKGISYLLSNSRIPTIIIKEEVSREKTEKKAFNWLIVLEKNYYGRIKVLESVLPLIDFENDSILGFGLYENFVPSIDPIEKEFTHFCEKINLKKVNYEACFYKNYISDIVSDKVNHGMIDFHFTCFMNNMLKHQSNPNDNDYSELVRKCSTNLCFINITSTN